MYFINRAEQLAIKWGTDSQVQYLEPTYRFPLRIGASGEMSLRVEDSRRLLVKVVGTEPVLSQEALVRQFRAFLMARAKPYLAQTMQGSEFGIFEVDARMGELSQALHRQLAPDFAEYGLSLERFFVTTIVKPEGDKAYEEFRDLQIRQYADVAKARLRQQVGLIDQEASAQRMVIESQAMATKRSQEGYTYQHERGFDVAEKVAQNEGAGTFTSAGIGLGVMGGVAGGMGATVAGMVSGAMGPVGQATPAAGTAPAAAAAPAEGAAGATDGLDGFKAKIGKLKAMREAGLLTEEEFAAQKAKLLDNL